MAKYVAEGVDVVVVTLTGGERGSILNPAMDRPEVHSDIAAYRRLEMARAAGILGVRHHWLGFADSGFPEGDPPPPLPDGCLATLPLEEAARPLVALVRQERPHVLLTYDEQGGYPHPDHVRCHELSVEAFDAAGDPDRYVGTGQAWAPLKLYYQHTFHRAKFEALDAGMRALGLESPYADRIKTWEDKPGDADRLTTQVLCAPFFPVRDQALLAHATQVDPNSFWFACPLEVQQRSWPTEDFTLARSRVPTTVPEDDLFAGVRTAGPRS